MPDRSTNPNVVTLAATISGEQQPEITAMKAFLVQWDVKPDAAADHSDMPMAGMVDDATMAKLRVAQGRRVRHAVAAVDDQPSPGRHRDGRRPRSPSGQNVDMISMAKNIVTAQQAEIDQMKQMLGG